MPEVGKLRNKIIFEKSTIVVNDFGASIRSWSTFQTVWSEKKVATANEKQKADQLDNPIVFRFMIRYRTDITPHLRIRHNTKYYTIHAVFDPMGDLKWLKVIATEIQQGSSGTV